MSELETRAERLTPREWRVVALVIEGVPTSQACERLGIASGTFESHKQAIRRKLGIPRGERLEKHLQIFAGNIPAPAERPERIAAVSSEVPADPSERRIRLLYRMTIDELTEVAGSAELRATLLGQTVKRMQSDDHADAEREIADLREAATEIRTLAARLLAAVRSRR
ncbi:MAG TPA: LuxR C-terminal-related transcriptional regulator [Actinomycetota bacterium]|nr:LuxR C-terminal-related transcriptional regulator [Actinomycetota bacterium]